MNYLVDLSIHYKTFKRGKKSILNDFELKVKPGEKVAIMGKSGVGKTSLLNIIGLIDVDYQGEYKLFDKTVKSLSQVEHATLRNKNIGFILQESALISSLSIEDNIKLPLVYYKGNEADSYSNHFNEIVEALGIQSIIKNKPYECSGGQRSRAAFARGIIMKPSLVLSDEPTSFLDETNKERILKFLFDLNAINNSTIITVTHEMDVGLKHDYIVTL